MSLSEAFLFKPPQMLVFQVQRPLSEGTLEIQVNVGSINEVKR